MRFALLLLVSSVAHAQPAKIDAAMKPWTGTKTPGCAVAVTQQGKVTFSKGYGMADLERNVPITATTVFDIGSVSKQFTAATIHLLAAEGKLKLDDDIRKHLPELPALSKQPVTIRHLLNHTGGLRDYIALLILSGRRPTDVADSKETLAIVARQKGNDFEPGAKWQYSNSGYFLLAQIAERAGKQSMAEAVRDRIFKPLGMTSSQVLDDHTRIVPNRAIGYAPTKDGWQLDMSRWEQTGDGAVQTTVGDLAKWDANFHDKRLGGAALIDAMELRGKLATGKELDYATGLFHGTYRGQPTIGHSGAWAGYRANLVRFPKLRSSVIVLCSSASANPNELSHQIADAMFDKQLGPVDKPAAKPEPAKAVELTSAELDAWVGAYREPTSGTVATIKRDGKALVVEAGDTIPLIATSKSVFRLGPTPFTLEFTGVKPRRVVVLKGQGEDQKFVETTTYSPPAKELAALAGRYWSDELQTVWTIRIENNAAVISNLDGAKLEFTSPTEASAPGADIALSFGKTRGFTMSSGSLRGLRFDRL